VETNTTPAPNLQNIPGRAKAWGRETKFFQPSESAGNNLLAAEKIKNPVIFGMI
jgi:hypothetical protein